MIATKRIPLSICNKIFSANAYCRQRRRCLEYVTHAVRRIWVRTSGPDPAHSRNYRAWRRIFFSRLVSRFLVGIVVAFCCLAAVSQAGVSAHSRCTRLDKGLPGIHTIHGRFGPGKFRAAYCLYALADQHVLINIRPSANLDTQGYLRFAGTPAQPKWAPGSPGGTVFNEAVPWSGKYWLVVGQRFNERKIGNFKVEISSN